MHFLLHYIDLTTMSCHYLLLFRFVFLCKTHDKAYALYGQIKLLLYNTLVVTPVIGLLD